MCVAQTTLCTCARAAASLVISERHHSAQVEVLILGLVLYIFCKQVRAAVCCDLRNMLSACAHDCAWMLARPLASAGAAACEQGGEQGVKQSDKSCLPELREKVILFNPFIY